ncbi:hypothetical protein LIER_11394 [Lithospermum erythrorhizon]|uniref:Gag-pol polyprotein n=1 Tax=Lithospermum erythrorhizon TaxID=34254 RepID=A0AAV3PT29_LITER
MANEAFALGEPISNEKQVRKVLRSIPPRFESKVTSIEEAQDLSIMRLDDLIRNLTTYEMKIDSTEPAKKKGIALSVSHRKGSIKNRLQEEKTPVVLTNGLTVERGTTSS